MLLSSTGSRAGSRAATTVARRTTNTLLLLARRPTTTTMATSTDAAAAAPADAPAAPATITTAPAPAAKKQQKPAKTPRQDPEAIRTIADNKGSPFYELGLAIAGAGKGRTRVRQHVNPLRAEFNAPPPAPEWSKLFTDPTRPLVVDVGCGQGRFLLLLARRMRQQLEEAAAAAAAAAAASSSPSLAASPAVLLPLDPTAAAASTTTPSPCNYLGIEIREPLVERANRWVEMLDLQGDVAFCFANATTALPGGFLDGYPGPLAACLVQFPDPHFKRKHHKRRVLQPALAKFLTDRIAPGGCVFLQSDIYAAAAAMRDAMEEWAGKEAFELAPQHFAGEGATFEDVGPPADQVRNEQQKQGKKKQQKTEGGEEEGGKAAAEAGEGKDDDDDNDDDDQAAATADTFVSEWSKQGGWLTANPIGVPTEREHYVTAGGGSVFRVMLRRRRGEATSS